MVRIIQWSLHYFAIVFAAGFVLGIARTLFLEPRMGTRAAELVEMPFLFVAILWTAIGLFDQRRLWFSSHELICIGVLALAVLLVAEATLVVSPRGTSISEYIASRDPVSGTVYLAMLGLFALMPFLAARISKQPIQQRTML